MKSRKLPVGVAVLIVAGGLVLSLGVPLVIYLWVQPPPGSLLASKDIQSGQSFQLKFVSDGRAPRVFLDLECESCSFPITGNTSVISGGKTIMSGEVSAGDYRDTVWGGHDRKLQKQLLFDAPTQPEGTEITITGTLIVGPARSNWSTAPVKGAPPPKVKVLRVSVAD